MRNAIKLVLLYFGFQILAASLITVFFAAYSLIKDGQVVIDLSFQLAPALFTAFLFMTLYLWKKRLISSERVTWSPVSTGYLLLSIVAYFTAAVIIDYLMSHISWIPDFLEQTFNVLQSGWLGILSVAVFGPILEELLFRGAITKGLLKKYSPAKAIILSALVFGVFHINPVQVISATLIGLLLGWMYYKTASLIPCILVHILNNSLAVYFSLKYPDVEYLQEFFPGNTFYLILCMAILLFAGALTLMKRIVVPYAWREEEVPDNDQTSEIL